MRINIGQTTNLFHSQAVNNSLRRNLPLNGQQTADDRRTDQVSLSPRGKSSGLLASLMNQKELIRMNKDTLIKRELGEDGVKTGNFSKQLEDYEKQLEELDEQIAREMAKQAQGEDEESTIHKDPRNTDSEKTPEENMLELSTENSAAVEKTQVMENAREKRERDKITAETELQLSELQRCKRGGSPVAERKLDEVAEKEQLLDQIWPLLDDDGFHLPE